MSDKLLHEWCLEHRNPASNKNKFYEIMIYARGGKFCVTRRFGRIGSNTKPKDVAEFERYESAEVKAQELVSAKQFSNRDRYTPVSDIRYNQPTANQIMPVQTVASTIPKVPDATFWSGMVLSA